MPARIHFNRAELDAFCRQYHVRRLSLFGSALRDDFKPGSDIDILYELEPGHAIGYFTLVEMADHLSKIFGGREVDLVNPKYLKPGLCDEVLRTAEVEYAEV